MSTLLKMIQEQTGEVQNNYNVNLSLNTLAALQESFDVLETPIKYFAECVPVFKLPAVSGKVLYCVEMDEFIKLRKGQGIDEATAVSQLFETVSSEEENDIENVEELAIIIEKEDVESLDKKIKDDPKKIDAKCEAVRMYTEMLERIKATGVTIIAR